MSTNLIDKSQHIGFITVRNDARRGLIGGFLVLNMAGRPLEFHCTAPLKPNRAQEILYGASLRPYLYGEQIARTLLEKTQSNLAIVMCDTAEVLALQEFTELPVIHVFAPEEPDQKIPRNLLEFDETEKTSASYEKIAGIYAEQRKEIIIEKNRLLIPENGYPSLEENLTILAGLIDFAEPFVRIRLAIDETQRAA